MRARLALIAILTMLAAGCDGGDGSAGGGDSAAELVPATTEVFVTVNTDLSSDQVQAADELLQKFPTRERLLRAVRESLADQGVDLDELSESVGPEVDLAVLDTEGDVVVALTQPRDEDEFIRQLESGDDPAVHVEKGDWIAFSDTREALDRLEDVDEPLSELDAYDDATADLPDEALATLYASGDGIETLGTAVPTDTVGVTRAEWVSAAAFEHDDGIEVVVNAEGDDVAGGETFESTLLDDVPTESVAVLSFRDLGRAADQLEAAGLPFDLQDVLGVRASELAAALSGEGILFVRPGTPIPEVTLIAKPRDPEDAARTVDRIVRAVGGSDPGTTTIDGATVRRLSLGPVSVFYGVLDDRLVVTDSANAIRDLQSDDRDPITDDEDFEEAREAAGLPDETNGFLYLDLKDGVPLVESLAELAGEGVPPEVLENLRPLRSAVVFGTRDGDRQTFRAFVQTS